jgi:hypothetical protein
LIIFWENMTTIFSKVFYSFLLSPEEKAMRATQEHNLKQFLKSICDVQGNKRVIFNSFTG